MADETASGFVVLFSIQHFIHHSSFIIRHSAFVIRHSSFVIYLSPSSCTTIALCALAVSPVPVTSTTRSPALR